VGEVSGVVVMSQLSSVKSSCLGETPLPELHSSDNSSMSVVAVIRDPRAISDVGVLRSSSSSSHKILKQFISSSFSNSALQNLAVVPDRGRLRLFHYHFAVDCVDWYGHGVVIVRDL